MKDLLVHELGFTAGHDLFVQPTAKVGKQRGSFDVVRTNANTRMLTNVWAFNLATLEPLEQEIQSWNFLVSRLRQDGAALSLKDELLAQVGADAPLEVVYDEPSNPVDGAWRNDIFEAAKEAWTLNNVAYRTVDEFYSDAHSGNLVTVGR